jgi:hypothetical protein
MPSNTP